MTKASESARETRSGATRSTRRETLWALLVCAVLLAAFLEKPLRNFADHHYTTADLTQAYSLTRVEPGYARMNSELRDPALQMQPWRLFARQEFARGAFPLWNPLNGCGAPHFANAQTAVLSPLSVAFYALPLRYALLLGPIVKLLLGALFTYLFLRRLALSFWPALTGAVAYAWSGYGVLLVTLHHPTAALALPAGLWCVDVACTRLRERSPHAWRALAGLVLAFALCIYTGEPAVFTSCALVVGAWTCLRLHADWRAAGGSGTEFKRACARGAIVAVAAVLAAGLGALQLVPYFEYLHVSTAAASAARLVPLDGASWPFLFFPNLLGNPVKAAPGWPDGPPLGLEHAGGLATSALVVFLAIASFAWCLRSRAHVFFAALALAWCAYAFDAFGLMRALDGIGAGLSAGTLARSFPAGTFAVCVCAAFALEHLGAVRGRARLLATIALALGAVLAAWFAQHAGLARLEHFLARTAAPGDFVAYARDHVRTMTLLFAAGIACVLATAWCASASAIGARLASAARLAVLACVFLPWGWMLRNYNTTVPDRFVFPRTEALDRLRSAVGDERVLVIGGDTLPANTNLVYGVDLPTIDDGLGLAHYDALWTRHFGAFPHADAPARALVARRATRAGLGLLGIRRVLTKGTWLPVETTFAGVEWNESERFRAGAIAPGVDIVQTFTATANDLQAIRVEVATDRRANRSTLWFTLTDLDEKRVVDQQSLDVSNLRDDANGRCELVFRFDPQPRSRSHRFALTLASPDATSSQCVTALATREFGRVEEAVLTRALGEHVAGELRVAGERVQGGLVLDLSYNREFFRRITEFAGSTLWAYEPCAGRFQVVTRALAAATPAAAIDATCAPDFDPTRTVVLPNEAVHALDLTARGPEEAELVVLERDAGHTRLAVRRSLPGWLVAAQTFHPGWRAYVNGREVPLLRANGAFQAVELAAGASEVEFVYAPKSFETGLSLTLASLLATLLYLALARRSVLRAH